MEQHNAGEPALGEAVEEAVDTAAEDEPEAAEIEAERGRLQGLIVRMRPGPGPVTDRWSLGIGDLLADHPRVPDRVRGMIRRLDRFGGVSISAEQIGYDGDAVAWSQVQEIRTRDLLGYLLSDAIEEQTDDLPLPWFPGRKRLLHACGRAALGLVLATAGESVRANEALLIPAEIRYRGTLRRVRTLAPGLLGTLILADPAVRAAITATAATRQIAISRSPEDDELIEATERAAALRRRFDLLQDRLRRE